MKHKDTDNMTLCEALDSGSVRV